MDKKNCSLQQLYLLDQLAAIMVGNSLQLDIAGARVAGMTSVWLRLPFEKANPKAIVPDRTITKLRKLLN